MKKRILSIGFVVTLFLGIGLALSPDKSEAAVAPVITCPTGDSYTCWEGNGITVYKGEGPTTITIQ